MSSVLRRLPLSRLLLVCAVVVVVGIGATAIALAVNTGPVPAPKPLPDAIHDALSAPRVDGVSASIQYTNHLLEGSNLTSGGGGEASQLASNPLLSGAGGRLWIGAEGHARLELQSETGDTQLLWDGTTAELYDARTNTLYRYTPPSHDAGHESEEPDTSTTHAPATVAQIEEAIARASKHATISGATPTDVAGRAAYTVRVSPRESGSLLAGAELSWDATTGAPLRAALYSTTGSAPVVELAATEISYGPVESSILDFPVPANAKVEEVKLPPHHPGDRSDSSSGGSKAHLSVHGKGVAAIAVLEAPAKQGSGESGESSLEGLQKVNIDGTSASELPTQLGTLLSFERAGVRYLLAGSVTPSAIEEFARGL